MKLYEILLRFRGGSLQGAHVVYLDDLGRPMPAQSIGREGKGIQWPAIVGSINNAAIARVGELEKERELSMTELEEKKNAELAALRSEHAEEKARLTAELTERHERSVANTQEQIDALRKELSQATTAAHEKEQELQANRAFQGQIISGAEKVLTDGKITESERADMLQALLGEAKKPAIQREAEKLEAEVAAKQEQLTQLKEKIGK